MKPVLVTTEFGGVFFGYLEKEKPEMDGNTLFNLKRARNVYYWACKPQHKGFMGLASGGPGPESKIGPPANIVRLEKVSAIVEVSTNAVHFWETASWA